MCYTHCKEVLQCDFKLKDTFRWLLGVCSIKKVKGTFGKILPMAKFTSELQKLPKLLIEAMEEQFIHLNCITYQEKQNGSVILTKNQFMEQLE